MTRATLKKWLFRALIAAPALLVVVFLGVTSGIVPVNASSGHWQITNWFLHYAMKRSVGTHSRTSTLPKLDRPWLVLKGAGHYETGCRPCHGAPDLSLPIIPAAMTPHPPSLAHAAHEWSPEELFYIVKHGVKFTAMPAWPALERDDEIAAVVAFLIAMPDLDAEAYRRLVRGETAQTQAAAPIAQLVSNEAGPVALAASCARCHGDDGEGRDSAAFPKLAGQKASYQVAALEAYARGERHSGIMQPIAAGMTPEAMRTLSDYYAKIPARQADRTAIEAPREQRQRGEAIAREGIPARGVPPCVECHGPIAGPRNAHYPQLAGQYGDYLILQLRLFKADQRGGSPYAHLMHEVARQLDEAQMRDVALYYAALTPHEGR